MAKPEDTKKPNQKPRREIALTAGLGLRWLLIVFVTALAYRGLCFTVVGDHPLLRYPVVDANYHDAQARRMAAGDWIGHNQDDVFKPPLYPAYLALQYRLFGRDIALVQCSQLLLGALSCVLLAMLASHFIGPGVGRLAGLLAAVYPPFVFFELQLLTPALSLFLNAAALVVLFCPTKESRWHAILAGWLLGLSAGVRPDVLLPVGLLLMGVLFVGRDRPWRGRLVRGGLVAIGIALVIVPITIRNAHLTGEFIPVSSNAGINLYTGNSTDADGISAVPVGLKWEHLVTRVPQEVLEKPAKASRWWIDQAWSQMRAEPKRTVLRLLTKALAFVNQREFRNNIDYHFFCQAAWPMRLCPVQLNIVLPLGACGLMWLARSKDGRHRRWALFSALWIAGYWVAGIVFFVTARFRMPAVPFLILPAALAWIRFYQLALQKQWRELIAGGVVLALAAVACWPLWLGRPEQGWALDYVNLCNSHLAADDRAGAKLACDRAIELAPEEPDPHYLLAKLLIVRQPSEALQHLRAAQTSLPNTPSLMLAVGQVHLRLTEPNLARDIFARIPALAETINLWPKRDVWARAHIHLAELEPERSQYHWDRAWSVDPRTSAEVAFLQGREPARVLEVFESEARDKPWDWYSQANLGLALLRQDRPAEAVEALRHAHHLAPERHGLTVQLAQALAQMGQRNEAILLLDRLAQRLPKGPMRNQVIAMRRELYRTR